MPKSNQRTRNPKPDVHFRLTRDEFERLTNLAEADRRSVSNLVEKIVLEWLAEYNCVPNHAED
jgi:hypothetical protein